MFDIYYYQITDNPSELLLFLDVILHDKLRLLRSNLSSIHNKQIPYWKLTKIDFHED